MGGSLQGSQRAGSSGGERTAPELRPGSPRLDPGSVRLDRPSPPARQPGLPLRTHLQALSLGSRPCPNPAPGPRCARLQQKQRGTGAATPRAERSEALHGRRARAQQGPAPGSLQAGKTAARPLSSPALAILIGYQLRLSRPRLHFIGRRGSGGSPAFWGRSFPRRGAGA